MPTYEYECSACDHKFDEFQSMKDEPLVKCPKCGKKKLHRLFGTGAALLFKGEGFYQTDYRSESYKAAAKADTEKSGGPSGSGEKAASGGDSKSEKPGKAAKSDASPKK